MARLRRFLLIVLAAVVLAAASGPGAASATLYVDEFNNSADYETVNNVEFTDDMMLEYGTQPGVLEDYTTYNETDSLNIVTYNATHIEWDGNMRAAQDAWLIKTQYSGMNFTYTWSVYLDTITSNSVSNRFLTLILSNTTDDYSGHRNANNEIIHVLGLSKSSTTTWYQSVGAFVDSVNTIDIMTEGILSIDVWYYNKLVRVGNNLTLYVYDDAPMTSLVESVSITIPALANKPYTQLQPICNVGTSTVTPSKGVTTGLMLTQSTSGYDSQGNATRKNTFYDGVIQQIQYNTTLNGNTVKLQYSVDGTNWYNSTGGSGYDVLADGVGIIDVDSFYWSNFNDFYYRAVLEGDGVTTPSLNTVRIFYEYDASMTILTELLWGTGAIIGHIVLTIIIIILSRNGTMGKLGAVIVAVVMFVEVLNNMPNANSAYVFAIIYPAVAVGLGLDSFR